MIDCLGLILEVLGQTALVHLLDFNKHVLQLVQVRHVLDKLVALRMADIALFPVVVVADISFFGVLLGLCVVGAFQDCDRDAAAAVGVRVFKLVRYFGEALDLWVWNFVLLVFFGVLLLVVLAARLFLETGGHLDAFEEAD